MASWKRKGRGRNRGPEPKVPLNGLSESQVREYLRLLAVTDRLARDSKLTEKDIMEIDEKIKKAIKERIEREITNRQAKHPARGKTRTRRAEEH